MRRLAFLILHLTVLGADYCGEGKIPIGFEVTPQGKVHLNCEKPDCMDREFSECPERAESVSCPGNESWVGGLDQRIDGGLRLRCCSYPDLKVYAKEMFRNITLFPGMFFESAVKFIESSKKDMEWFDLISNVKQIRTKNGTHYQLTLHRFNCTKLPEDPPSWWKENQWPFWGE